MGKTYTLNNGQSVAAIGFGTWQIAPEERAQALVSDALTAGYRVIDTARIYGNEHGVGAAITQSEVPRQNIFLTSKLWNDDQGFDRAPKALAASLERLGQDYLDLYLIHWPASSRRHDSWRALEQLYQDGRIKAAGVSNYTIEHLEELLERSPLVPAVNQVEFHPFIYQQQAPLLAFCAKHGILVEAYSPLRRISREQHGPVQTIAAVHKVTPQQVVLRWCIQHGTLPLARSTSTEHLRSNLAIDSFKLTNDEMASLDNLSDGERVTWDPAGMGQ